MNHSSSTSNIASSCATGLSPARRWMARFQRAVLPGVATAKRRDHQVVLAFKVPVERRLGDPRLGNHPIQAYRLKSVHVEEIDRFFDQPILGVLRLRSHAEQFRGRFCERDHRHGSVGDSSVTSSHSESDLESLFPRRFVMHVLCGQPIWIDGRSELARNSNKTSGFGRTFQEKHHVRSRNRQ
ncbi:MAG: hypothetical protein QM767_01895 [Anaeromyxobacter sp.]